MTLFEIFFPKKHSKLWHLEIDVDRLKSREKYLEGQIEGLKSTNKPNELTYYEQGLFELLLKKNPYNLPPKVHIEECYEAIIHLRSITSPTKPSSHHQ